MTFDAKPRRFGARLGRNGLAALLALALAQCGAPGGEDEATAVSAEPIVGGDTAAPSASPVLYLEGPQGTCTSVLVAPTLVATARHCTAQLVEGIPSCSPEGDLIPTGSGAGEIGADDSPGKLRFFTAERVARGRTAGSPDAVGVRILSTKGPSICCDDLAFVVLDHAVAGTTPAPVRIDPPTEVGESVSVFGYGLTGRASDATRLRVRGDAQIAGVGPEQPTSVPQAAPLRSIRVGPGVVTCNGDSGGPIVSTASGAVVALVSLGSQASAIGPYCNAGTTADTTGPLLSDYGDLVRAAFQAAGSSPIPEPPPGGTRPPGMGGAAAAGGACALARDGDSTPSPFGVVACGVAVTLFGARRRKR